MIIELKDCEKWIEDHKTWILPVEGDYATPMIAYGAEGLLSTVNDFILPSYGDGEIPYQSLNMMIQHFWDFYGGVQTLRNWMERRNAEQIIFDMLAGGLDADEVIDAMFSVLRLSRQDKYSNMIIKHAIDLYNSKQTEDSSKVHNYEYIFKEN